MPTFNQLSKNLRRKQRNEKTNFSALENCPQKKGICLKVFIKTPKKPNSALRKVVKVKLTNLRQIIAYIPGEGHNLQDYSTVAVKGGRVKDLPGVKYRLIRGRFDLLGIKLRQTSRSKYGSKKTLLQLCIKN